VKNDQFDGQKYMNATPAGMNTLYY